MKDSTVTSCASPVILQNDADADEEILNCPICMDTPEDRGVLDCVSALAIVIITFIATDNNQA